ncbi:MAG: polyhydroxyalkanoic acid system family protein [Betaproteobacteria bacterium]|jgi:putative polyhydroxyalkanoate system protein
MSDIHYVRKHSLSLTEAKKKVQQAADHLADEYDLQSEWEGDTLHFTRSGVDGHIAVTAKDVTLDVKLGFLLRAFKTSFERHIERNLDDALAGKGGGTAGKAVMATMDTKDAEATKATKATKAAKAAKTANAAKARKA